MRVVVLAAAAALAPTSAFAADYLSAEQAAHALFPDADAFEPRELTLDAQRLRALADRGVRARSARWSLRIARKAGAYLGTVVVDEVIGKFELITYAVGIGADGRARGVEVLSYRESHGHEIRLAAWRRQFVGKGPDAPLQVGDDIAGISGATLSCEHVTEGVRRIVRLVGLLHTDGTLR